MAPVDSVGEHIGALGIFQWPYDSYDACAGSSREMQFANMNKTLLVGGFALDEIDEYTEVFEFRMRETAQDLFSVKDWPIADALAFGAFSAMPTQEMLENLVEILIPIYASSGTGRAKKRTKDFAAFRLELSRSKYGPNYTGPYDLLPEGLAAAKTEASEGSAQAFVHESGVYVSQKRLFKTKSGLVGLGPHLVRSGDLCCVLYGGNIPFLLRPVGSSYKLVGEICIEKVMQGEAMVDFVLGDMYHAQTFSIS